ncbi:peptide/nickel transport system substrate-binding protein [Aliicoccus persicus]|uniref:Peptide/nickel transport system substrate-binding protein n=2 Tax=Aliicoccus persicus TaxID=930138 RepID=A0A662Z3H3_9STAP|nr:peptide/nickel transport system substrate-binding protein [Aliicoccus persicus]
MNIEYLNKEGIFFMRFTKKKLMSAVLGTGVALAVLGVNGADVSAQDDEHPIFNYEDFPKTVSNDAEPSGEGELRIAYSSDAPFEGTFNWAFYTNVVDSRIMGYFDESVFTIDENQMFTQEGAMQFDIDEEERTVTFTLQEGVLWHDGVEATIHDYVASYEVIGHPDYEGVRGSTLGFSLLEGFNEYRDGEADEISGIEVIDDYTAVFHYEEIIPSLLSGGFWAYLFPTHHYEGLEVGEIAESDLTRQTPIGIGPYQVSSISPGESVTYERFDDYWRGTPSMDGIVLEIVSPSTVATAMQNNDYHYTIAFPVNQFPDVAEIEGVEWLANMSSVLSYVGFKLGEWDDEAGEVDYKPEEMKMGDIELRRAMWHAIDNETVAERFYNGLRWEGTTLLPPYYASYFDETIESPEYSPEIAEEILDEAGYEYDGDYRLTPEGEELEISMAFIGGSDVAEALANYYIQSWRNVGLNVSLYNDRMLEFNAFYDMVDEDAEGIDIYQGSWAYGSDADPAHFYGRGARNNYPRYASEANDELLEKINSPEAFDNEYRTELFYEWQELMREEMPVIPILYGSGVHPVSTDVVNFTVEYGFNEETALYNIGLVEEEE